jgi:hypothetical protein
MPRSFRHAFDIGRCLRTGARALQAAPLPLLLGAVLMECTERQGGNYSGGGGGGGSGDDPWDEVERFESLDWQRLQQAASDLWGFDPSTALGSIGGAELLLIAAIVLGVLGLTLACGLLILAFRSWIHTGWIRLHHELLQTGQGAFATLFGGGDAFFPMAGFKVVAGLIHTGIFLLSALPGIGLMVVGGVLDSVPLLAVGAAVGFLLAVPAVTYVWLGLYFGQHAVALDGAGTMQAVERSWELARGHRLWLLLYLFVTGLIWLAGHCLCCVGVFATRALVDVGRTEAYLFATRDEGSLAELWSERA